MGLTVTEREHWKERIAARINRKIEAIKMANKEVFDGLRQQARERAVAALGVGDLERERVEAKEETKRAEKREKLLTRKTVAAVRGVDMSEVSDSYYGNYDNEIAAAIKKRQDFELELLAATIPAGEKITALQKERESLLDTVWLATSPAQVKELWEKLGAVLGDEVTPLQKQALSITAAD